LRLAFLVPLPDGRFAYIRRHAGMRRVFAGGERGRGLKFALGVLGTGDRLVLPKPESDFRACQATHLTGASFK
jgi:hypothetical protein